MVLAALPCFVRRYYELVSAQAALKKAWAELLLKYDLDAVLLPPSGLPALPHGETADLTFCLTYMFLPNLLLWPAGTVPTTVVRPSEASYPGGPGGGGDGMGGGEPLPEAERDSVARLAMKAMEGSAGLPVGVQVMAPMHRDEQCLRVMRLVEECAGFAMAPPLAGLQL